MGDSYKLGDIVYMKLAEESYKGMVVGIYSRIDGGIEYKIAWCDGSHSEHYAAELCSEFLPEYLG